MQYTLEALDEIHRKFGNDSKIRKFYERKIRELKKRGFYIDLISKSGADGDTAYDMLNCVVREKYGADASKSFELVKTYDADEKNCGIACHQFVSVNPKKFRFSYVDFNNYFDVMHVNSSVVYLNSFWGIYIECEEYHMHELVQFDFFTKIWKISPVNLYDGGNLLLPYNEKYDIGINISHNGAIFSSWEEYVEANRSINEVSEGFRNAKIAELKGEIEKLRKKNLSEKRITKKRISMLEKVMI